MKRLLWLGLLLIAAVARADDVPLPNAGFDEARDGKAVGWRTDPPAAVAWREDGGHTGAHYMRLTDPDNHTGVSLESTRLPCRPDGVYVATAWIRTTDKCSPGIYLNFYDDGGNRTHHLFQQTKGPTDGWVQARVQTTAPDDVTTVSVTLYAYGADVGAFDADDVTLSVTGGAEPGTGGILEAAPGKKEVVSLDSRRELFVDGYLVDSLTGGAVRRMHQPQRRDVAFATDAPWEGETSAYFCVVPVDGKVRIYFRGSGKEGTHEVTCVVESEDGVHFTRPKLGLFDWQGNKDNSIVWMEAGTHNFTPFLDPNPAAPADQRFKALASAGPNFSLVAFVSADGYHWRKLREAPVITKGDFDSQNLAFWDSERKLYVEYHRKGRNGFRDIMTSTSPDFLTWTEPQFLDYGDAPWEHLYTNAIVPYFRAPHIYLGFPNRLMEQRQKIPKAPGGAGVNDALLMSSRDMIHFERWREAFIYPSLDEENWTDRNNYVAWGIVPRGEREIAIYSTDHYRHETARLVLNTIRTDGFASIYAPMAGGQMLTRPFTFTGKTLEINYATSAAGSLKFALCDEAGKAFPGFSIADSEILFGNEIAHTVAWAKGSDVRSLAGKTVRLRVSLKDADLFSLQFHE